MSSREWAPVRKFFALLERCDGEMAEQIAVWGRCARCGGKLHRADFPRVPRGGAGLLSGSVRRVSFCCAARECRRRFTPPSLSSAMKADGSPGGPDVNGHVIPRRTG